MDIKIQRVYNDAGLRSSETGIRYRINQWNVTLISVTQTLQSKLPPVVTVASKLKFVPEIITGFRPQPCRRLVIYS